MKMTFFLFSLIILISCSSNNLNDKVESLNSVQTGSSKSVQLPDTTKWIDNFKKFRDAVYQADKAKTKEYIDFKSLNKTNRIWELIYLDNESGFDKITASEIKPFTEKDYEKYFDKIFSKQFIRCIQKIKTEELSKTGTYQTIEFKEGKAITYLMSATYDKTGNTLKLDLASNTIRKDADGEILDGGECSIMYFFSITNNGQIQLAGIGLAG